MSIAGERRPRLLRDPPLSPLPGNSGQGRGRYRYLAHKGSPLPPLHHEGGVTRRPPAVAPGKPVPEGVPSDDRGAAASHGLSVQAPGAKVGGSGADPPTPIQGG